MHVLVLGGIRSGKSRCAETVLSDYADRHGPVNGPVNYVATGPIRTDSDWVQRVQEHRDRRPACWQTVETTDVAAQLRARPGVPTVVDDLGNWLTAALDRRGWDGGSVQAEVADLVAAVRAFPSPLVLVSPEVGLGVIPATAVGRRFADELGLLNQRLAECCSQVALVVAGLPLWLKRAKETD